MPCALKKCQGRRGCLCPKKPVQAGVVYQGVVVSFSCGTCNTSAAPVLCFRIPCVRATCLHSCFRASAALPLPHDMRVAPATLPTRYAHTAREPYQYQPYTPVLALLAVQLQTAKAAPTSQSSEFTTKRVASEPLSRCSCVGLMVAPCHPLVESPRVSKL
jgi:hypothetical protein